MLPRQCASTSFASAQHAVRDAARDTRFDTCAVGISCLHRVRNPLHLPPERFNGSEFVRADESRAVAEGSVMRTLATRKCAPPTRPRTCAHGARNTLRRLNRGDHLAISVA